MFNYLIAIVVLAVSYLVGALPTGYWFTRYFFGIDITHHGSGNIGATNVARVFGKKYFLLIFLLDAGKAVACLYFFQGCCKGLFEQSVMGCLIGAALIVGNSYSIFMHWCGGKSVATLIGIVIFLYPWYLLQVLLMSWAAIFLVSRYAFIASICSSLVATIFYWLFLTSSGITLGIFLSAATMWLVWRHTSNLKQFFFSGA